MAYENKEMRAIRLEHEAYIEKMSKKSEKEILLEILKHITQ